jgi:hypothetical protein
MRNNVTYGASDCTNRWKPASVDCTLPKHNPGLVAGVMPENSCEIWCLEKDERARSLAQPDRGILLDGNACSPVR